LHRHVGGRDLDLGVAAQPQLGLARERDRADARRALEGAVGRVEIGDLEPVRAQLQLEVIAGDALVGVPTMKVPLSISADAPVSGPATTLMR
jgi:hypothetical protein